MRSEDKQFPAGHVHDVSPHHLDCVISSVADVTYVIISPGLLPIFLHGCGTKSGRKPGNQASYSPCTCVSLAFVWGHTLYHLLYDKRKQCEFTLC